MSATATHEANRSYRDVLRNQHVAGLGTRPTATRTATFGRATNQAPSPESVQGGGRDLRRLGDLNPGWA